MSILIIWVIVLIAIAIASSMRKQKIRDAQRKNSQQAAPRPTTTKTSQPRPNVIVEKAKQNTQDVHSAHVEHEKESRMREYGGGARTPQTGGTFGTPQIGTAASGVPESEKERIKRDRERLQMELQKERSDANSQRGNNRIMEAAKENALETRIENLTDSSRDFMKEVQELMVKGPNDTLPNQRDFVAEGMEMVNRALIR